MKPFVQRGAVLIMVLWTAVVLTVLVTVLATNVRLSATTAYHHKTGSRDYALLMSALQQAEMELMMERMPVPVGEELALTDEGEFRIPAYRFNGQPLSLHYPADQGVMIRIYDHAGKVNLNRIPRERLQQIIEKKLGTGHDPMQVQALLAAWADWTDLNELVTPGGAEDEYYLSLDPPYTPRNSPDLESVEELRLIRGFDELFSGINLEAAFTVYGTGAVVNPNLASREALIMLPGMDEELADQIIAYRQQRDIRTMRELGEIIPLESMVEVSPWLGFNTSSFYSVFVYKDMSDPETGHDPTEQALMQIMEVRSFNTRARVYRTDPYGMLPVRQIAPAD